MKKLESKWTYAVLLLPMILCVFYSKLCDVNAMMKESRLIFDPYGSAGITWAYWNHDYFKCMWCSVAVYLDTCREKYCFDAATGKNICFA